MTEPSGEGRMKDVLTSEHGNTPLAPKPAGRYCSFCGEEARTDVPAVERFGDVFCSDEHAEAFVQQVRMARVQAAASVATPEKLERGLDSTPAPPARPNWKRYLTMAACCGAPLLALVVLAGGGGALLGAAGSLLPVLALLACPLGMFFMMWAMSKAGHHKSPRDDKEN